MTAPTDYLKQSIKNAQQLFSNNSNNKKKRKKQTVFPCSICNSEVKHNDKAIFCTRCEFWAHIRCNDISINEYKELQQRNSDNPELVVSEDWICMKCILTERSDLFPFLYSSDIELYHLNSLDSIKLIDSLPNDDVHQFAGQNNKLVIDEDIVDTIDSKYYSCDDFFNMDNDKSFNILHSNVNGYLSKADNILEFLSTETNKTKFDIVCVSETSLVTDDNITNNAKLAGFSDPFMANTQTSKGGVAIFAKDHSAIERPDLKIENIEFEGVWIEINNISSKNVIVGCV